MNKTILTDTPLEKPEEDRLGYAPFARNLADSFCKVTVDDCLVFALFGPWGCGKTTCLNFVWHYITEKPEEQRPVVVQFNPWWFSGHGDLLQQFFREFCVSIGKEEKFKKTIEIIANLVEIASEIPEPTGISKLGGKLASRWLKQAKKDKEVWKIRESIKEDIRKQNRNILVVIDDIDRLPSEEIRDLFKVIKAVADFPKTTYLLAFDKDVVVKALKSVQETPGEEYLEKIIQVPFHLPIPEKDALRKFFLEQMNLILSDTPEELFDKTYWGNVFWDGIDHFLNTMRDVKRFTNALRLTYPSVKGEVNPVDFIAVKTVEVFSSDIYQLIRYNPDMFAVYSDTFDYSASKIEGIKPFHNKWVEQIPEEDREVIKQLLIQIFPKLEAVFGNTHHGAGWESTWRKQLRICSPDIFPVYFRLAIPGGQISRSELEAILALTENIEAFSNKLLELSRQHRPDGSTRVSTFLERLQDYTQKDIPKQRIPVILQALFNVGDELLVPEDESRGLFGWSNDIRIGRIMFQLLKRFETQEERFNVLKEVFSSGYAASMIVSEVSTLGQQHGKYSGQAQPDSECLIIAKHLEDLEKIALLKIRESASNGKLLNTPHLAQVLYRWSDWEDENAPREWVSQAIASDDGLVDFLTGFLSKGYSQSIDDRVSEVRWRLDPKLLEPFIDPSGVIQRCKNLLKSPPEWLKGRKRIAIETFVKWYELRVQGMSPEEE
jgi:predicted KAP-like P-loop ATPase